MAEEEEGLPSAPRKKEIEISKGVVLLPPERIRREEAPAPRPVPKAIEATPPAPATPTLILSLAVLLSVISIIISFVAISGQNTMKTELGRIAADLRSFKDEEITLVSPLAANHTVEAKVPLREIISSFMIPIMQDVPVSIEGTTYHPAYGSIVLRGNATARFLSGVLVDPSNLSDERTLLLKYSLLGGGTTTMVFKGADLWTEHLNDVLTRLERLSK